MTTKTATTTMRRLLADAPADAYASRPRPYRGAHNPNCSQDRPGICPACFWEAWRERGLSEPPKGGVDHRVDHRDRW